MGFRERNLLTFAKIGAIIIALIIIGISTSIKKARIYFLNGEFNELVFLDLGREHVYYVAASDTLWDEMKKYGNIVSRKRTATQIYFVIKDSLTFRVDEIISVNDMVEIMRKSVAKYERRRNGEVILKRDSIE